METKEVTLTIRVPQEVHRKVKVLAAKEGKTLKECILAGLDKAFPGWREQQEK